MSCNREGTRQSQVQHEIHFGFDLEGLGNVLEPELECRVAARDLDVALGSGKQVVQTNDAETIGQQAIA